MNIRYGIFFALLCATGSARALDVSDQSRFVCKQGSCFNGSGAAWDALLNVTMQGNWSNGNTIPGATYTVTSPAAPNKQFKQVYGQDGMLDSGDQPRSIGVFNGVVPFFNGSYGRITHAFLRQTVAVANRGVYDTGIGIQYRGRFEYLAAKSGMNTGWGSGFYIFYGERVDTEENETETGLFISDETMGGAPVRFIKAEPSYLAVMQGKYQRDMELAKGDFRQQESEQGWRTAFSVIGKVAFTLASGGGNLGGGGSNLIGGNLIGGGGSSNLGADIAMNLVSGIFNKGQGNLNIKELASQALGAAVTGDKQLGSALGKAISEGIDEANRK